jgi:hypothetical protein
MNREEELNKQFPLEDGTTYIQNLDVSNEPKGAGVGGESIKENFIDSASLSIDTASNSDTDEKLNKIYEKLDRDFMYNWIKRHKNR